VSRSTRIFTSDCDVCGMCFVSRYTTMTCGPPCAEVKRRRDRREDRDRSRAVKRNAFVANVPRRAVYERDGWRAVTSATRP